MKFENRIKDLLKERGLKQADLCRMSNISPALMSYYVNGERSPALDNAIAIAGALQVTLDELVGNTNETVIAHKEQELLKKYRAIDSNGRDVIDTLTNTLYAQNQLANTPRELLV